MSRAGISLVLGRALIDTSFLLRLEADPLKDVAKEITNDLEPSDIQILKDMDYNKIWDFRRDEGLLFGEKYH